MQSRPSSVTCVPTIDHRPTSILLAWWGVLFFFSPLSPPPPPFHVSYYQMPPLSKPDVSEFQVDGIQWSLCLACLTWFQSLPLIWPPWCLPEPGFGCPIRELGPDFSSATIFLHGPCIAPDPKWVPNEASQFWTWSSVLHLLCHHQCFTASVALYLAKGPRTFMFKWPRTKTKFFPQESLQQASSSSVQAYLFPSVVQEARYLSCGCANCVCLLVGSGFVSLWWRTLSFEHICTELFISTGNSLSLLSLFSKAGHILPFHTQNDSCHK